MKPIIALNVDVSSGPPEKYTLYKTYADSVAEYGGIPILVPPTNEKDLDQILQRVDGVLLIGGDDYSPELYGETALPTTEVMPQIRELFDLMLMRKLRLMPTMPLLGICGGCQLMNVALGGSLIQDIGSENLSPEVAHRGEAGWKVKDWHEVSIHTDTRLFEIYGKERINVPTAHRQAVRGLADELRASATTDDGVIEGIELPDHDFGIGVQWHPERDLEGNRSLFSEFIKSAITYAAR